MIPGNPRRSPRAMCVPLELYLPLGELFGSRSLDAERLLAVLPQSVRNANSRSNLRRMECRAKRARSEFLDASLLLAP